MQPISLIEYQDFLKLCDQIFNCHMQSYQRIQITLRLLEPHRGKAVFCNRSALKSLQTVLEKVWWINCCYQTQFKGLAEEASRCAWNAIDPWCCDLVLEDQRNIHDFLRDHTQQIDAEVSALCLSYPHAQVPGFYFVEHLKKIVDRLWNTHQQQQKAIKMFEQVVLYCRVPQTISGSERFYKVIHYCNFSLSISKALKQSIHSNRKNRG
jgi:hypothetical protein